jgi:hypothetical protein
MYFQAAIASPPTKAIGNSRGLSASQTWRKALRSASAGIIVSQAIEPLDHPLHRAIVFFHLLGIPPAICGVKISVRTDFPSQAREEKLVAGVHQVQPRLHTLLWGCVGVNRRGKLNRPNGTIHGHSLHL